PCGRPASHPRSGRQGDRVRAAPQCTGRHAVLALAPGRAGYLAAGDALRAARSDLHELRTRARRGGLFRGPGAPRRPAASRWRAGATLGEIRQRADLVVFWAVDPGARYPRYGARYVVEPRGVAAPQGRKSRMLTAVDVGASRGPADADGRVALAPTDEVDGLEVMRAAVQGRVVEDGERFRSVVELAQRMTAGRYVAMGCCSDAGLLPRERAQ